MSLIIMGAICFIVGLIYKSFPPKNINYIYGWRTSLAMKNQETWKEAQKYGANLFVLGGLISAFTGFLLIQVFDSRSPLIVGYAQF